MDHYLEIRDPGYLCGGDDREGGIVALVPTQDSTVQERQRSKLPPVLQGRPRVLRSYPSSSARFDRLQQTQQG